MHGKSKIQVADRRLLPFVEAVADLFPASAEVLQAGEEGAPALLVHWRTAQSKERAGNFHWGALFRFVAGTVEAYEALEPAQRRVVHARLRGLAENWRFSYEGADSRSLLVIDVPETLFDVGYNEMPKTPSVEDDDANRVSG